MPYAFATPKMLLLICLLLLHAGVEDTRHATEAPYTLMVTPCYTARRYAADVTRDDYDAGAMPLPPCDGAIWRGAADMSSRYAVDAACRFRYADAISRHALMPLLPFSPLLRCRYFFSPLIFRRYAMLSLPPPATMLADTAMLPPLFAARFTRYVATMPSLILF